MKEGRKLKILTVGPTNRASVSGMKGLVLVMSAVVLGNRKILIARVRRVGGSESENR